MLRSLVHMESAANGCVTNEKENLREVQTGYFNHLTPGRSFVMFVIDPYSGVAKVWREVFSDSAWALLWKCTGNLTLLAQPETVDPFQTLHIIQVPSIQFAGLVPLLSFWTAANEWPLHDVTVLIHNNCHFSLLCNANMIKHRAKANYQSAPS